MNEMKPLSDWVKQAFLVLAILLFLVLEIRHVIVWQDPRDAAETAAQVTTNSIP